MTWKQKTTKGKFVKQQDNTIQDMLEENVKIKLVMQSHLLLSLMVRKPRSENLKPWVKPWDDITVGLIAIQKKFVKTSQLDPGLSRTASLYQVVYDLNLSGLTAHEN